MAKTPLVKKLRIPPGQRVLKMNPPPGYINELGELPEAVEVAYAPEGAFDFVHLRRLTVGVLPQAQLESRDRHYARCGLGPYGSGGLEAGYPDFDR